MEEERGEGEMEGSHTDGVTGDSLVPRSSLISLPPHRRISLISSHPPERYPRPSASVGQAGRWVVARAAGTHKDPESDIDYV